MGKKATKGETELRVNQIVRMMANGVQRPAMIEYAGNNWGITRGAVDNLIRKAKDRIKESVDEERADFIARKLFQLEDIVLKSAKLNHTSAMIGAIKVQIDLAQVLNK